MAELHLSPTQETLIARLAAACGRSQAEILDEALLSFAHEREERDHWMAAQMPALAAVWDNDDDAAYDRL